MSHARLAPSDAEHWGNCPGSLTMQEAFPESGGSEASRDGDACHWVSAEVLQGRGGGTFLGRQAPNGVVIDDNIIQGAMSYVEYIASRVPGLGTSGLIVEERVSIPAIHETLCSGTPDARYADVPNKHLHIFELKYGWGIVEPEENKQEICYASGVIADLAKRLKTEPSLIDQEWTLSLHISQPRAPHKFGPNRCWTIPAHRIRSYINQLHGAAEEALGENPRCISGVHCRYCTALHGCGAAAGAAYSTIDVVDSAEHFVLDNDTAVSEYLALKRAEAAIKNRLSAQEGSLIGKIQSGEWVPGVVLERGSGRAKWNQPAASIAALGDVMGVELRAPETVVTPAQSRAKGLPSEVISAYSTAGSTGLKLIVAGKSFAAQAFRKQENNNG